jgi:lysozyme
MGGITISNSIKKKIFIALIAAGVGGPSAYVATELTTPSEGFYTSPYDDPVGLKTWCIGHLGKKGEAVKKIYTEDECVALFVKDWKYHEKLVEGVVKVPFRSEWMKGAVTDFTFNKGIGNLTSSTLLKDLNAGRYDKACMELTKWVYGTVDGKKVKLKGLEIRASNQYKYCMGVEPSAYKPTLNEWGYYVE